MAPPLYLGCSLELLGTAFKPLGILLLCFFQIYPQLLLFSLPILASNFLPQHSMCLLPLVLETGWTPSPVRYRPEKLHLYLPIS